MRATEQIVSEEGEAETLTSDPRFRERRLLLNGGRW
jgi:hypothetical protein